MPIRPADMADLPQILAILNDADMDNGEALSLEAAIPRMQRFLAEPWRQMLVAEAVDEASGETRILGFLTLFVIDHLSHSGGRSALLEEVIVAAAVRGQGVGQQLCRHALELAKAQGCYKIALSSNLKRLGAHQFYENLGYHKHGYSYELRIPPAD